MMFLSELLLVAATADTIEFAWLVMFGSGQPTLDDTTTVPPGAYMHHSWMAREDRASVM